jgi:2-phospho-L-lactate/phosphoenolpyruvate guanylyltransferase
VADSTWAVLPVKPFDDAKSRLAPVLDAGQRRALARELMQKSLDALLACKAIGYVLVVSSDVEALSLATQRGALTLAETGSGLNAALEEARLQVIEVGATSLLVLASDLPLLATSDVEAIVTAGHDADVVIAPDRRGEGTNALLLRPADAIEFSFGLASSQRHAALAVEAGHSYRELKLSGLAFDIDLPEDWNDLQSGTSLLQRRCIPADRSPQGLGAEAPQ